MYNFINTDRLEISTGGKVKNELERLIQDIGLGYPELLLDNLKQLGDNGFSEAKELFNKLMELRSKECKLRLNIESPQQLDEEIRLTYWLDFKFLYGYTSIVNYIVYNGEITLIDEEKALDILYEYYKNNPQDVADKIEWLVKNEKYLCELSKATRDRIMKNTTRVNKDKTFKGELNIKELNSILNF